ncbi:MAG TPA: ATP-binding protein [Verrucomicrobiae bacterium]|jgi:signal transduction histidine kinase|nr:ATP-binding protein [Verrucomicrobiae bacterium]
MDLSRRSTTIYGLLLAVWVLVLGWQVEEHVRFREAAKTELRGRAGAIATFLSATIRGQRWRNAVIQDRLEPVLDLLVNGRTNELVRPSELVAITLLNSAGDPVVSVGDTNLAPPAAMPEGEYWGPKVVTFVNPVYGVSIAAEGETNNSIIVLPGRRDLTNEMHGRDFPRPEPQAGLPSTNSAENAPSPGSNFDREPHDPQHDSMGPPPPPDDGGEPRGPGRRGRGRPPWMNRMSDDEFKALITKRELHGLVLAMSTEKYRGVVVNDLWLRFVILFFAGISAAGFGLAWRTVSRTSELQIRLVRASELNTHLREMNLAAAGLAHETRNPLNIIRGMAQMLSRQADATPEIKEKSHAIVNETDKVTAQLNEFINYSRPREIRRATLPLHPAIQEVVRALNYDIEEKKVKLEVKGEPVTIEADEQLFRQMLFNLLLNAVQALDTGGEIQVVTGRKAAEAFLEVRDNGQGVPLERRKEIFKPYFTTHQKGTGLGLAVVQQIVLAHGWEIECLSNEPKGAVFRITHLTVTG